MSLRSRERKKLRKILHDETAFYAQTVRDSIPTVGLFTVMVGKGISPRLARQIINEIPSPIRQVGHYPAYPAGETNSLAAIIHAPFGIRKPIKIPRRHPQYPGS